MPQFFEDTVTVTVLLDGQRYDWLTREYPELVGITENPEQQDALVTELRRILSDRALRWQYLHPDDKTILTVTPEGRRQLILTHYHLS